MPSFSTESTLTMTQRGMVLRTVHCILSHRLTFSELTQSLLSTFLPCWLSIRGILTSLQKCETHSSLQWINADWVAPQTESTQKVFLLTHIFQTPSNLKGTQDWDFFWLRFWNLYYFFISYVKILRFYKKNFWIRPLLGEMRFFRLVWD